ncbi:MAG: RsmF rRNA methyltransferase first C-terminal domain-containing protein [Candidatus Gallimonas sp.]
MNLPEAFCNRMKEKLGAQYPDFLRSYELPVRRGIRVNTLKLSREEFLRLNPFSAEQVPWEENGFYIAEERAGAHPYHFAGLYYCQEPSAMCAAPQVRAAEGERVLDLCAAPGGKTTRLAQGMTGSGVLVANEYSYERAKILSQNVERLGIRNCVVTNADSARIAEQFPLWFDKALVDAPCSGEGMFKKEPNAIPEWSEEAVARCAARQAEILENAATCLRGGGLLVYSTCTFSEEENGGQIAAFLAGHPDFTLLREETLMPHLVRGEGHYCAVLRKAEGAVGSVRPFPVRRNVAAERAFAQFSENFFERVPTGITTCLPDGRLYLLPDGMPDTGSLRVLRASVEAGEFDGKLFRPAHALAMSVRREEVRRFVSLSLSECEVYLHGETVRSGLSDGWCVVGVGDYPLGLGKIVNGTVKNHLPKGLRKLR